MVSWLSSADGSLSFCADFLFLEVSSLTLSNWSLPESKFDLDELQMSSVPRGNSSRNVKTVKWGLATQNVIKLDRLHSWRRSRDGVSFLLSVLFFEGQKETLGMLITFAVHKPSSSSPSMPLLKASRMLLLRGSVVKTLLLMQCRC